MIPTAQHEQFLRAGRWSARLSRPFARIDYPARLSIPARRPLVLAGNHRSFFDVFVALAVFARFGVSARILIRADLVDGGMTGSILRGLGSISTSSAKRESAEDEAVEALRHGQMVSLMPEGRLVRKDEWQAVGVGSARPGLSRIVRRAGATVVPVAIVGTELVWPRDGPPRLQPRRPVVRVRFGEPMEMVGDDDQGNTDEFMAHLGALVRRVEAGGA
jgi:putative phosphoserine phosphatase/1-acylglycerol-3-phosphate O-acyltransferase